MKKKFYQFFKRMIKISVPLCCSIVAVCVFVANHAPNMCWGIWGYEEPIPESLRKKC